MRFNTLLTTKKANHTSVKRGRRTICPSYQASQNEEYQTGHDAEFIERGKGVWYNVQLK